MFGIVKWYSEEKKFGFIIGDDKKQYYFNEKNIKDNISLKSHDYVMFINGKSRRGLFANNVCKTIRISDNENRKTTKSHKKDDRENCQNCKRRISPKLVIYGGCIEKTLCPYCEITVMSFSKSFIPAVIYEDPSHPQVRFLRSYRDNVMRQSICGKVLVFLYYKASPIITKIITKNSPQVKKTRKFLNCLIENLRKRYKE